MRYGGMPDAKPDEKTSLLSAAVSTSGVKNSVINVNQYMLGNSAKYNSSKSASNSAKMSNNIIRDNNSKSKVNPLLNNVQNNLRRKSLQSRGSVGSNRKANENDLNNQPLNSFKYIASEVKVVLPIDKKVFLTDDIRLPMTEFIYILEFLDIKSRMRLLLTKKTLRHWRLYVNTQRGEESVYNNADGDINIYGVNDSYDNNSILSYDSDSSFDSSLHHIHPNSRYYHFDGRRLRNHLQEHQRSSAPTTISYNSVINSVNAVPKKRHHTAYGSVFDSSIDTDIDVAYDNLYTPLPTSLLDLERGSGVYVQARSGGRAVSFAAMVFSCLFARSSLYEQPFVLLSSVGVVVAMMMVAVYVFLCNLLHLSAAVAAAVIAFLMAALGSALCIYTRQALD